MYEELIKAITLPGKVVDGAMDLVKKILDEPAEVTGDIITDKLREWQWINRISIAAKANARLKDNPDAVKLMPKGFFMRFLDASGYVEDEELQELWSRLLADAAGGATPLHPILLTSLQGLGVEDARVLNQALSSTYRTIRKNAEGNMVRERFGFKFEGDQTDAAALSRLELLGFVRPCPHCLASGSHIYISHSQKQPYGDVTQLGVELHRILDMPVIPTKDETGTGTRLMVATT